MRPHARWLLLVLMLIAPRRVEAQRAAPSPATLDALERAAIGPPVDLDVPPTRAFCNSPRERWVRAHAPVALPSCEPQGTRIELRGIDRSWDRLDAEWLETGSDGVERVRHRALIVGEEDVFAVGSAQAVDLARDVPRGPFDAWRAALLLLAADDCIPGLDIAPAGLGAAGERVPSGVRGSPAGGYRALVWLACPATTRDAPAARIYRLESVQRAAVREPMVSTVARYARGVRTIRPPPAR